MKILLYLKYLSTGQQSNVSLALCLFSAGTKRRSSAFRYFRTNDYFFLLWLKSPCAFSYVEVSGWMGRVLYERVA